MLTLPSRSTNLPRPGGGLDWDGLFFEAWREWWKSCRQFTPPLSATVFSKSGGGMQTMSLLIIQVPFSIGSSIVQDCNGQIFVLHLRVHKARLVALMNFKICLLPRYWSASNWFTWARSQPFCWSTKSQKRSWTSRTFFKPWKGIAWTAHTSFIGY